MRTKVTLVLIFLNVALFYFIFFVGGNFRPAKDTSGILGPEVANIQTLTIGDAAGETLIRLERRSDKWLITKPIVWPANEFSVRSIINELQFLRPNATFDVVDLPKSGQSLADYGLEKPLLTLSFTAASVPGAPAPAPVLLRIGDSTKVGNLLYILSPDGQRIHVVPRSLAENLIRTQLTLRSDELFTIPVFEASSLTLEPANSSRIRFRRENDRWFIEGLSVNQTRASKVNTELALGSLREWRVASFVPETETSAVRASLATPALRITIQGNNRRETLLLGPPAPVPAAPVTPPADETAAVAKPPVPATLYYALMESEDSTDTSLPSTLFTVSVPDEFLKSTLLNAQRELREKQILDFDPAALSAIALSTSQTPDELVLQRLEAPASSAWQIVRRSPGRVPQPEPADRAIVDRLISDLARLSAQEPAQNEEILSAFIDAPSEAQKEDLGFNRPARTLILTTTAAANTPAPAPVRLLIGVGRDRRTYAKLAHQETIYRVSDEILRDTPADPLYYRQRLIRELPATTPIIALKLTDLTNDSVLLETALPLPADAPATTSTAIESLVAQLRTLRAKNFTSTEFTKTVFSAGEERPWKFRLDATLSPAGGNADARPTVTSLFFSDRAGGDRQLAGSAEFNLVFEVEQPLLDALFVLTYGPRDPGPSTPPAPPAATPAP
jgi:hypothetical protein